MESILVILGAILSIILFFKIWRMTDDIKDIKIMLRRYIKTVDPITDKEEKPSVEIAPLLPKDDDSPKSACKFSVNQLVIIKSNQDQFRVTSIKQENGKIQYYSEKFDTYYPEDELEDFDAYWAKH